MVNKISQTTKDQVQEKFTGIGDRILHGLSNSWGIGRLIRAILPASHKYSQTANEVNTIYLEVVDMARINTNDRNLIKKMYEEKSKVIKNDIERLKNQSRITTLIKGPPTDKLGEIDAPLNPKAQNIFDKAKRADLLLDLMFFVNEVSEQEPGTFTMNDFFLIDSLKIIKEKHTKSEQVNENIEDLLTKVDDLLLKKYKELENSENKKYNNCSEKEIKKLYDNNRILFDPKKQADEIISLLNKQDVEMEDMRPTIVKFYSNNKLKLDETQQKELEQFLNEDSKEI